jgi:hypothetical protein
MELNIEYLHIFSTDCFCGFHTISLIIKSTALQYEMDPLFWYKGEFHPITSHED